ncbi:hypothetical protein RB16p121 [Escherichia phage RB16]|uniref:Conserved hypothetical phage protein n=1 Tax=Escherichia phage RB16 TaxID=2681599 RepID=D9ICI2_BPRB1|nr:hypothetical protein RB16p121 [Escherichia phage RB16]ADJ55425.1 conserved hypothetical phage protein [Escherichia phage RB16]
MKEVNLYTGYIDKRDVRRVEDVVSDMLTLHIDKTDEEIAEKIREALYAVFARVYSVEFRTADKYDTSDYVIRVEEAQTEKFDFYTWGSN